MFVTKQTCVNLKSTMLLNYVFLLYFTYTYGVKADKAVCFPPRFLFGVATASYQIEGAWNVSGKSESIWDRYTHQYPERVVDHKNGDFADNSYYKYKEDVQLIKNLGASVYRFSLSWPRILPDGLSNNINEDGIKYYRKLIQELEVNGITPLVTLYHWDLPQCLQDLGGWTNPLMAEFFADYARVVLDNFGDKVKLWATFNEPLTFCLYGYGSYLAPGLLSSGYDAYLCAHNVLRAHGMVYRMFDREYRRKSSGAMGIVLNIEWQEPASSALEDLAAAETARQFRFGWYANPIFSKSGDYPAVMRQRIDQNSKRQGYPKSRLPVFTREELRMIRGSYDYLGLNHYTTYMAKPGNRKVISEPSFDDDMNVMMYQKEEWPKSNSTWLRVVPWGFRKALNWIKKSYENPLIIVTENGISEEPGLKDVNRVKYIDSYLRSLHAAITIDKVPVLGYLHWSLMDNFEWLSGFTERFGLCEVDYKSGNFTRTPRLSYNYYRHVTTTGCLPNKYNEYTIL